MFSLRSLVGRKLISGSSGAIQSIALVRVVVLDSRFKDTPGFCLNCPYKRTKNKRIGYRSDFFATCPEIIFYNLRKNKIGGDFRQKWVKYTGSTLWRFWLKNQKIDIFENLSTLPYPPNFIFFLVIKYDFWARREEIRSIIPDMMATNSHFGKWAVFHRISNRKVNFSAARKTSGTAVVPSSLLAVCSW